MTMTADEVVRKFYESYNDRDLDKTYEQYVSHDLINHAFGGAYDRAGWLAADQGLVAAFADLRVEVLDQNSDLGGFMAQLTPTTTAEMKRLVGRWVDVVNSGTNEGIESVWAPDCVVHAGGGLPEVNGVASLGGLLTAYRAALADMQITTESLVAEGDVVAARFTTRGRHDGEFLDIPATGVPVEMGGFGLFRIAGGQIAEEWLLDDLVTFMAQVNADPSRGRRGES